MMFRVIRALVLAAGASSRMGRPKAGLALTDRADTFASHIVRTLTRAGLPEIVVITGSAPEAARQAVGRVRRQVSFVHNEQWSTGQLSSLLAGLQPRRGDVLEAILVTLVDAPFASVETVVQVVRAWRETHAAIVRPANGDQHGHPVVFDRAVFDELRGADLQIGAKAVVRARAADIVHVTVDDPGAFIDVDTEHDYQRALRELRR